MTIRPMREDDIPILRQMHADSGFDYDFPDLASPLMECVMVVANDDDQPIMGCAVERILQLYLLCGKESPAVKNISIQALHDDLSARLREGGYREVNAFLPPQIAKTFGRRLERTFGWVRNWQSWMRKF